MKGQMRKKIVQITALALAAAVCLGEPAALAASPGNTQEYDNLLVRAGLAYGSTTLAGANLANKEGAGYRFGYYEGDTFVPLGYTGETAVSVVITENVAYGYVESYGRNGYSDQLTGDVTVGKYHLQSPASYANFEDAFAAGVNYTGGFVAWLEGGYYVRMGSYPTQEAAMEAQAALGLADWTVVSAGVYGLSVVKTGTNQVLFQYDNGQNGALAVKPGLDDSVKPLTTFKGVDYYGDFQYQRRDGGYITVVNVVNIDDYVKGVVPHEMSTQWPLEALKAQAICARTYAVINQNRHKSDGFGICPTTHCQMYVGRKSAGAGSDRAVEETKGTYMWYNGKPAEAVYYSCSGGGSESVKNVWGSDIPYLVGVIDPYEPTVAAKTGHYGWKVTFTPQELKERLHAKGRLCADIVDMYVAEYTPTGNVKKLTFVDANGESWSFLNSNSEACRHVLGLKSAHYSIEKSGGAGSGGYAVNDGGLLDSVTGAYAVNGSGQVVKLEGAPYVITAAGTRPLTAAGDGGSVTYTVTGSGWGHSVGMSQWGAYAMAQQGFTCDQILKFYFTGIEVG